MSNNELLGLILMIGVFMFAMLSDNKSRERKAKKFSEADTIRLSGENILSDINQLEAQILQYHMLPDAIRGRDAYIFRFLIKTWFKELSARYRYDQPKRDRICKDILTYMSDLQNLKVSSFLSMEGKDTEKAKHDQDWRQLRDSCDIIEDALAQEVGPVAVRQLREARTAGFSAFSKVGEMAPEGYEYEIFTGQLKPTA